MWVLTLAGLFTVFPRPHTTALTEPSNGGHCNTHTRVPPSLLFVCPALHSNGQRDMARNGHLSSLVLPLLTMFAIINHLLPPNHSLADDAGGQSSGGIETWS